MALHLIILESPLPKDALCQVWLKLAQYFRRRRWKCEKYIERQTDGQTTDINDQKSSLKKHTYFANFYTKVVLWWWWCYLWRRNSRTNIWKWRHYYRHEIIRDPLILLNYHSFRYSQTILFLDKSTRPTLPFMVFPLYKWRGKIPYDWNSIVYT